MEFTDYDKAELLYTTDEAEKYLKLCNGTLKTWRYRGYGPDYIKVGRFVRYSLSDLNYFISLGSVKV